AEAIAAGSVVETGRTVAALRPVAGGGWEVGVDRSGGPDGGARPGPVTPSGSGHGGDDRAPAEWLGADAVIVAAGPWCAELGAMVGIDVPIVAVRGQMWASEPQPSMLRHAIAAAESALAWSAEPQSDQDPPNLTHKAGQRLTRHLYGRQRATGEIIFGGDRVLTVDRGVDRGGIGTNHGHVAELLPFVGSLPPATTWAGLMPFTVDGKPILGPVPDHDGLFLAGGLASSGFGRGPMTGRLIADLVMGRDPEFETTSLAPGDRVRPLG
ncbi:MAG: NAD(P)/FAD-dependent oxidoreductase, partial [Acidimicrobiales bacterium]